jgi:hypothetical protein
MKLRWLIVGTLAAVVGGVLVAKHFVDKDRYIRFEDNDNETKYHESSADTYESQFEGTEFLI